MITRTDVYNMLMSGCHAILTHILKCHATIYIQHDKKSFKIINSTIVIQKIIRYGLWLNGKTNYTYISLKWLSLLISSKIWITQVYIVFLFRKNLPHCKIRVFVIFNDKHTDNIWIRSWVTLVFNHLCAYGLWNCHKCKCI